MDYRFFLFEIFLDFTEARESNDSHDFLNVVSSTFYAIHDQQLLIFRLPVWIAFH